ncbi:hypothetical protein PC114_g23101 [Phytophthora cactorum]|nr:hypothetical protein PC114_g23101 [Phytophthora cactorum]
MFWKASIWWKGVAILFPVSNGWCWFSRTMVIFSGVGIACGCYSRPYTTMGDV